MRLKYSIGIVLIAIVHLSNSQGSRGTNQRDSTNGGTSTANLDLVADSVTNLANKISLAISNPKSKTEIFSPVSIAGALSLLLLGAGGITKNELLNVMGFSDKPIGFTDIHKSFGQLFQDLVSNDQRQANVPWRQNDKCNNIDYDDEDDSSSRGGFKGGRQRRDSEDVEISIGNGVFSQTGTAFDDRYKTLAERLYKSKLEYLDFEKQPLKAANFINQWVREETRGKIPEIVSQLSSDTLLVLANTLYFKADWENPFIKDGTRPRKFFPDGPSKASKDVAMMVHGGCFPYYYWEAANTQVIGIPYKKNNTMYVFMPKDSDKAKLKALLARVNGTSLNEVVSRMDVKNAAIQMPKLEAQNAFNLKDVLKQIGAHKIFDEGSSDLYRILLEYHRLQGSETSDDLFDALDDTEDNARKLLRESFPDCKTPFEKDIEEAFKCRLDRLCRFGGQKCLCCPKKYDTSSRAKRSSSNDIDDLLDSLDDTRESAIDNFARAKRSNGALPKPLYVNEVIHKVNLVMNEKGTEAGAVTATLIDRISSQVNFRANGPFLFVIRNELTKLPLFYGTVYDPTP